MLLVVHTLLAPPPNPPPSHAVGAATFNICKVVCPKSHQCENVTLILLRSTLRCCMLMKRCVCLFVCVHVCVCAYTSVCTVSDTHTPVLSSGVSEVSNGGWQTVHTRWLCSCTPTAGTLTAKPEWDQITEQHRPIGTNVCWECLLEPWGRLGLCVCLCALPNSRQLDYNMVTKPPLLHSHMVWQWRDGLHNIWFFS